TEDAHLVIPAQNRISPKRVHHRHPSDRRVLKAVHEHHRNLVWIIRLDLYKSLRVGELLRVDHRREPDLLRMLPRKTHSYWCSEIRIRWQIATRNVHGLSGKWVDEFDLALAPGESSYCGDSGIHTRRSKWHRYLRRLLAAYRDKRRACAFANHAANNKLPTYIEFVGRNQLVILWSPEAIRNWTVGKQILASVRRANV